MSRLGNTDFRDYYTILEVHPNASLEEIKQKYRFLATFYHPDTQPEAKKQYATRKMAEINEAYEVLSDPARRAEYDRLYTANASGIPHSDEIALVAYSSAQEMVSLLSESGFLDQISGKEEQYRERAIRQLATIVTRWPTSQWAVQAQLEIMMLYANTGRHTEQSLEAAAKLKQMAPKTEFEDIAELVTAKAYNEKGMHNKAIEILRRLEHSSVELGTRPEATWGIAETYYHGMQRYRDALTEYERFLATYPNHEYCAMARYNIARILDSHLHDYHAAIQKYEEVMRLHPNSKPASDCGWRIQYIKQNYLSQNAGAQNGCGCCIALFIVVSTALLLLIA